jgi:hypothetical protein
MKTLLPFVCLLAVLLFVGVGNLPAKIRNGYEPEFLSKMAALERIKLRLMQDQGMSPALKRSLRSELKEALNYVTLNELTEKLLFQLTVISPQIYSRNDHIRDKQGRATDIYVKLVPKDSTAIKLLAASYVWQSASDKDLTCSAYGERSASIVIMLCDQALFLLSHELGHLNYIVPNLARYTDFYNRVYSPTSEISYFGHHRHDESGKSAEYFQRIFLQNKRDHIRNGGGKPQSPLALINPIRRSIKNSTEYSSQIAKRYKDELWPPPFREER